MTELLLAVALLGLIAAAAVVLHRRRDTTRARHTEAIKNEADVRGWHFEAEDTRLPGLLHVPPFGEGVRRSALNVVRGVHRGRDVLLFEYRFQDLRGFEGFGWWRGYRVLAFGVGDNDRERVAHNAEGAIGPHPRLRLAMTPDLVLLIEGHEIGLATPDYPHWVGEVEVGLRLVDQLLGEP